MLARASEASSFRYRVDIHQEQLRYSFIIMNSRNDQSANDCEACTERSGGSPLMAAYYTSVGSFLVQQRFKGRKDSAQRGKGSCVQSLTRLSLGPHLTMEHSSEC